MSAVEFSHACMDITKQSEGCQLTAYWDANGKVWTIGWGHTGPDVVEGLQWDQAQADLQLAEDLDEHCQSVISSFPNRTFTQGQLDALTDLFFNIGAAKLKSIAPIFWKDVINSNDSQVPFDLYHEDAAGEPHGLIFAGGVKLPGLIIRRQKEIVLWNS